MIGLSVKRATLVILLFATPARAQSNADDHLLAGAEYFRQEQYRQALVEFRVAERTGSDAASWYVASTLVKLRRPEEAIIVFARAEDSAAADRDELLDYYHALACYDAKLYGCADRLLAGLGRQAGPRIATHASKIRLDLASVISTSPSTDTIEWYHDRGTNAETAGQGALAIGYYDEALRLSALRPDRYRRTEASAALRRLQLAKKASGTATGKRP